MNLEELAGGKKKPVVEWAITQGPRSQVGTCSRGSTALLNPGTLREHGSDELSWMRTENSPLELA